MIKTLQRLPLPQLPIDYLLKHILDPSCGLSDGANMLKLALLEELLIKLIRVREDVILN